MAKVFAVNLRGTKDACYVQISEQVPDTEPDARAMLHSIIEKAPGDRVSFQGAMNRSTDAASGNINIQGSFWTKE